MGYSMAGWKLNLGFLKEHQVLLATVPFLLPRDFISDSWLASLLSLHRNCYIFYDILKNQMSIKHLRRRLFGRPRHYEQGC